MMRWNKKTHTLFTIVQKDKKDMLEKQLERYGYKKFETISMNTTTTAHSITVPTTQVHHAVNSATERMDRSKNQMNKWAILALSASATFMTTLDSSIVNIGLPSIANTFHVGISG